jgi:hypothetical protein
MNGEHGKRRIWSRQRVTKELELGRPSRKHALACLGNATSQVVEGPGIGVEHGVQTLMPAIRNWTHIYRSVSTRR